MKRTIVGLFLCLTTFSVTANTIGFEETFALAGDRTSVLEELVPGTEEYYFYHALHLQQTGDAAGFEQMMDRWAKRIKHSGQRDLLRRRQTLLNAGKDPGPVFDLIQRFDSLSFSHSRRGQQAARNFPTRFNTGLLDPDQLLKEALHRDDELRRLSAEGLDRVDPSQLNPQQLRVFLQRQPGPFREDLVGLIANELAMKDSRGFGSLPIHNQLTLAQLDALAGQRPDLRNNGNWVTQRLARMAPPEGTDWVRNPESEAAHLDRVYDWVKTLSPAFNSIKAMNLYRRIELDLRLGTPHRDRLLAYLALPRPVSYIERDWIQRREFNGVHANLNERFAPCFPYPPIGRDEEVVRELIGHFLVEDPTFKAAAQKFLENTWLDRLEAEMMILSGNGDPEQWAAKLPPALFKSIRDRVEIRFAPGTPLYWPAQSDVSLKLELKEVDRLVVKVFRINTFNYYRETGNEVDGSINLDGLVTAEQQELEVDVPPLLRKEQVLPLPACKEPGTYVVELVGNGFSSRAILRKGHLRAVSRPLVAGTLVRVFDEAGNPAPDTTMWIGDREFAPDEKGRILVPFSESGGRRQAILRRGSLASLETVELARENYALRAEFDVSRERLIPGHSAEVVIRPRLVLGDKQIPMARLKDVRLQIAAVDHEGTLTETEIRELTPSDDQDLVVPFRVPEDLRSLSFTLQAKIHRLDGREPDELSVSDGVAVNGEAASDRTRQVLVRRDGDRWLAEVRGRNGEFVAGCPVRVDVNPVWVTFNKQQQLQTDDSGRIDLGNLPGARALTLHAEGAQPVALQLGDAAVTWPPMMQVAKGSTVRLPHAPGQRYHLLQVNANHHVALLDQSVMVKEGMVSISGLDAGLYRLLAWPYMRELPIRVVDGVEQGPYLLDGGRIVRSQEGATTRIAPPQISDDSIRITLPEFIPGSRVSVVASAFMEYGMPPFTGRDPRGPHRIWPGGASGSHYQIGRQLGDEVRYVLERQQQTPYPGNLLGRPELLLFPWVQQETTAADQLVAEGKGFVGAYGGRAAADSAMAERAAGSARWGRGKGGEAGGPLVPDLRWLAQPSVRWDNLVPDDKGEITLPRKALDGRNLVDLIVTHPLGELRQRVVLPLAEVARSDRRLMAGLDPKTPHAEVDRVTVLSPGKETRMSLEGATFEPVGDVAGLFQVYKTLVGDARFDEFSFIGRWNQLDEPQKQERFEDYGSHELNLFLYFKDRPFFDAVVKPYLENKLQQDFMDRWLLGKDLSEDLVPDRFNRLHPAEQVLLAWRTGAAGKEAGITLDQIATLWKPDRTAMRGRFNGVLRRSGLDGGAGGKMAVMDELSAVTATLSAKQDGGASFAKLRSMNSSRRMELSEKKEMNMAAEAMPMAPPAESAPRAMKANSVMDAEEMELVEDFGGGGSDDFADASFGSGRLYRPLERTKEWAETFYYKMPFDAPREGLSALTPFWIDVLSSKPDTPVRSERVLEPVSGFTEALFALALIDLPFDEGALDIAQGDDRVVTLKAATPVLLFQRRVETVSTVDEPALLVAQRFFDPQERTRRIDGEEVPVFVTDGFVKGRTYGGQVVVSNPNPQPVELDVLIQIPGGSLPVANGFRTRSTPMRLGGYSTQRIEYTFYFPESGDYAGCPVQLALAGEVVARAAVRSFKVLDEAIPETESAWARVARHGTDAEVLEALRTENLARIDLSEMYYRLKDPGFFAKVADLFAARQIDDSVVYSYAVQHKDLKRLKRYLPLSKIAGALGPVFRGDLLTIDPFQERVWQHLEYHPLVNPRAHQLGAKREIPNARMHEVYTRFMTLLGWESSLSQDQELMVTYYLLLQDRLEEGLARFDQLEPKALHSQLQYDYLTAYVSFYRDGGKQAAKVAKQYREYPVPVWRKRFAEVENQLAQISGGDDEVQQATDRNQQLDAAASAEAFVKARVEGNELLVDVGAADSVTVRYYPMDVELLFSQQPFLEQEGARFRFVQAAIEQTHKVNKDGSVTLAMPEAYRTGNVHVELEAGGALTRLTHLASTLQVRVLDQAGLVDVRLQGKGAKPVAATYVKVYARLHDGTVRFWKDGYTDLRGRFDFVSRNDLAPSTVDQFALLVVHPEHGAVLEEAGVPVQ